MTTSNTPEPRDVLAGVDLSDIAIPGDIIELAQRSILASQVAPSEVVAPAEAIIRLSGDGVVRNRIGAREASRIIGGLQETLAAIGQALTGNTTTRGQIPQVVRRQTALNLFPVPAAGSVQLHLESAGAGRTAQLGGMVDRNLADEAAASLVRLMDEVAGTDFDETTLVEHLHALGPRVARQVQQLASELVTDDVDLDLTWRRFAEAPQVGHLHRDHARRLRDIIKRNRVEAQMVTMVGTLVTVSRVRPAALFLTSGRIVTLVVDDGMASTLGPYYNHRVRVQLEETVTHEDASGRERVRYQLVDIALAHDDQEGEEPLDAPME